MQRHCSGLLHILYPRWHPSLGIIIRCISADCSKNRRDFLHRNFGIIRFRKAHSFKSILYYRRKTSLYPICSSKNVFPVFLFCHNASPKKIFILPYFTYSEKVVALRINPSNESQEKSKNINLSFSQLYVKIFLLILRREESIFVESNTI